MYHNYNIIPSYSLQVSSCQDMYMKPLEIDDHIRLGNQIINALGSFLNKRYPVPYFNLLESRNTY